MADRNLHHFKVSNPTCERAGAVFLQGSKFDPIAFILKIKHLPRFAIPNEQEQICEATEDQDTNSNVR